MVCTCPAANDRAGAAPAFLRPVAQSSRPIRGRACRRRIRLVDSHHGPRRRKDGTPVPHHPTRIKAAALPLLDRTVPVAARARHSGSPPRCGSLARRDGAADGLACPFACSESGRAIARRPSDDRPAVGRSSRARRVGACLLRSRLRWVAWGSSGPVSICAGLAESSPGRSCLRSERTHTSPRCSSMCCSRGGLLW